MVPDKKPIFVLCHVPKTAGTSVGRFFVNVFGSDRCAIQSDPMSHDFLKDFEKSVERGVVFFSGHVFIEDLIAIKREYSKFNICILTICREPIKHFYSLYLHNTIFFDNGESERKNLPLKTLVKSQDIKYLFDLSLDNVTTRYFSGNFDRLISWNDYVRARRNLRYLDYIFDGANLERSVADFAQKFDIDTEHVTVSRLNSNIYDHRNFEISTRGTIPAITANLKYDFGLYAKMSKIIYQRRNQFFSFNDQNENELHAETIYLSEMIRRRNYFCKAQDGYFAFLNNDILLHPPLVGSTSVQAKDVLEINSFVMLCDLELSGQCAVSVIFKIEISSANEKFVSKYELKPGESKSVRLEIKLHGLLRFKLSTKLAPFARDNAFARAIFRNLRIFSSKYERNVSISNE